MADFYVTIIHRPEMVPEYIQKEAEQGKVEDLTRNTVLQEALDIFRTQQQIAHDTACIRVACPYGHAQRRDASGAVGRNR